MLSILFGLLSALTWGAGDFSGGIVSRRAGVYRAAFYGEAAGLIFLAAMLAVFREALPPWKAWPGAPGRSAGVGRPAAAFPLAGGGTDEHRRPGLGPDGSGAAGHRQRTDGRAAGGQPNYIGFGLALLAIWLISQGDGHQTKFHLHLADLRMPLLSGFFFRLYFIFMHKGSQDATVWPMIARQVRGAFFLLWFALAKKEAAWPARSLRGWCC